MTVSITPAYGPWRERAGPMLWLAARTSSPVTAGFGGGGLVRVAESSLRTLDAAGCWMLHSVTSSGPATPTSNIPPCPQQCAPEIRQASLLLGFVIQEHIGAARPITSRSSPPRFVPDMVTVRTGSVGRCSYIVAWSVARQVVSSPSSVTCYTVLGHPLENVNACLCN
jgi:hypothetical protein